MIVCLALKLRKSKNKVAEACVVDPSLDVGRETIIPNTSSTEVPSTLEVGRVKLQSEQGVDFI